MLISQEKINEVAERYFNAKSEEKRVALDQKLQDMCIRYLTRQGAEATAEAVADTISKMHIGDDKGKVKKYFDSIAFAETYRYVILAFDPSIKPFMHLFNSVYRYRLNNAIGENIRLNKGIDLNSRDVRLYRSLDKRLAQFAAAHPEVEGTTLETITELELLQFCQQEFNGLEAQKAKSIWQYIISVKSALSMDAVLDDSLQLHEIVPGKDEVYFTVEENRLPELMELLRQVYEQATRARKKYYSCFNMAAVVGIDELLEQLREKAYVEWRLLDFVRESRQLAAAYLDEIKDTEIAGYLSVDKSSVSREHKAYRYEVTVLRRQMNKS